MAVRIPGPDDIERRFAQNGREVVDIPVDPMAGVFANLAERGEAIANRLIEQRDEAAIIAADTASRRELDALMRKLETGADPTAYESQYETGAREILTRNGGALSRRARGVWEQRSAALVTEGVIGAREGAQRRALADVRASIDTVAAEADRTLADSNVSAEAAAAAVENVRLAAEKARERGVLPPDDATAVIERARAGLAEREQRIGLLARTQAAEDAIFAGYESYAERLNAARALADPVLRASVEDAVTQRQNRENAARDESVDAAYGHIAAGEAIPSEVWSQIPGRDQVRIQDYRRARARELASGGAAPRDPERVRALELLALDHPERFARLDISQDQLAIGHEAYVRLRELQNEMRGGDKGSLADMRTGFNVLRDIGRAGLEPYLGDPSSAPSRAFDAALLSEYQSFRANNQNAEPSPDDAQTMIARAMTSLRRRDYDGERLREATVSGDRGLERGRVRAPSGVETVVPFNAIDEVTRRGLIAELTRRIGRVPTRGEVQNAYAALVRDPEADVEVVLDAIAGPRR